jgi:zinc and cadmium transporter
LTSSAQRPNGKGSKLQPELLLALYCGLIVGVSALGGLVPLWWLSHTRLHIFLSFAAGVMFGAAMLHMLFEAIELTSTDVALWLCVIGVLTLFFTERFFSFHHHEAPVGGHKVRLSWPAVAIGLSIHTLTAGIALASAVMARSDHNSEYILGLGVFLAIVLHQPADSFTIVTMMLGGGASRKRAHWINFLFAMTLPLGSLLFFVAHRLVAGGFQEQLSGAVLAFSAGMFLCIALSDLLPELHFHEHDRAKLSAALLLGVGFMFGVSRLETHHHHGSHHQSGGQNAVRADHDHDHKRHHDDHDHHHDDHDHDHGGTKTESARPK